METGIAADKGGCFQSIPISEKNKRKKTGFCGLSHLKDSAHGFSSACGPCPGRGSKGLTDTSNSFQSYGKKLEQLSTDSLIVNKWANRDMAGEQPSWRGRGGDFFSNSNLMQVELQVGLPRATLGPNQLIPNDLP